VSRDSEYVSYWRRTWLYVLMVLLLLFLAAPIFVVIPVSFSNTATLQFPPESLSLQWYERLIETPRWRLSAYNSLVAACLTVCCTIPFGVLAAYGLNAISSRLAKALWGVLMLPLAVPLILLAIGVYFLFARVGLINTMPGLVAAHTMYTLPVAVMMIAAALRKFDQSQEMVARSLGASRGRAFFTVTLPQIKFSVISASFLTFIASFDEVVIALFISGGPNATLPRQMFNQLRNSIDPTIAAVSTILIVLALVVFTAMQLSRSSET